MDDLGKNSVGENGSFRVCCWLNVVPRTEQQQARRNHKDDDLPGTSVTTETWCMLLLGHFFDSSRPLDGDRVMFLIDSEPLLWKKRSL